jgi:hypothetical protein
MGQLDFMDALLNSLGKRARPQRCQFELRCCGGAHPLLWIVPFNGGLVPVVRHGHKEFSVESSVGQDGIARPVTFAELHDDDVLPIGNCECGRFQGPTKRVVEQWIAQDLKFQLIEPQSA